MRSSGDVPTRAVLRASPCALILFGAAFLAGCEPSTRGRSPLAGEASVRDASSDDGLAVEAERGRTPTLEGRFLVLESGSLRASFAEGARISVGGTTVSLRAVSLGRGDTRATLAATASPRFEGAEVHTQRTHGVVEWWRAMDGGLEHGVTIAMRPAGEGQLVVELGVDGLRPRSAGADAVDLLDAAGAVAAGYAHLLVLDATGVHLPAMMLVRGRCIVLRIDDARATYPVIVDPLLAATREAELRPSDGAGEDWFGISVALTADGSRALVGAMYDDTSRGTDVGSARVFLRTATSWVEEATLLAADGAEYDLLGASVALSGDGSRALVSAHASGPGDSGGARVFLRTGTSWVEEATLLAPDRAPLDLLGYSVALSSDGSLAVLGAPWDDTPGGRDAGSARVFVRTGTSWAEEATLLAPDGAANDQFGIRVALTADGNRAVVTAPLDDTVGGPDRGSARVFLRTGTSWAEEATLLASDGDAGDRFGWAAALAADGSRALVGAYEDDTARGVRAGSARVFSRTGTSWAQEAILLSDDGTVDGFGYSVALTADGSRALVGAPWDDTALGAECGSARLFSRTGASWTEAATLSAPDGAYHDELGVSVALVPDGSRALVGAYGGTTGGGRPYPGSAQVFTIRPAHPDGVACADSSSCLSGFCSDGVCCEAACGGTTPDCEACTAALTGVADGTCAPTRVGTTCRPSTEACDPAESCAGGATSCPADVTVCAPTDAGPALDAGPSIDAGTTTDGGTAADAGSATDAGSAPDASRATDGATYTDARATADAAAVTDADGLFDAATVTDASRPTDAVFDGSIESVDGGAPPATAPGCSCRAGARSPTPIALTMLLLGLVLARRRGRSVRPSICAAAVKLAGGASRVRSLRRVAFVVLGCGASACAPAPTSSDAATPIDTTIADGDLLDATAALDAPARDTASPRDAAPDLVVRTTRPVAPLSTATVTARRPMLRWSLEPGMDGAHVEVCRDRACTMIITSMDVTGTSAAPGEDLPVGVVFWRFFPRMGAMTSATPSPTWQFTIAARSAPIDTSWGTTLDVNGDGYADLAVGAYAAASYAGRVHVYLGSGSGLGTTPSVSLSEPGGFFGNSVAGAGDVNGDGYADLAVGTNPGMTGVGHAYVYLGGESGLSTSPAVSLTSPDGAGDAFGGTVVGIGDVNGDGYADLAVAAPYAASGTGRAYVYLGSPAGLGTTPATTLTGPDGQEGYFGPVSSAGDVNGDGYADLAVVASSRRANRGYVYLGSASGLGSTPATIITADPSRGVFGFNAGARDVNGDGYADLAATSYDYAGGPSYAYVHLGGRTGLDATPATTLTSSEGPGAVFGVSSFGDLDGDGYADLLAAEGTWSSNTGRVQIYLGSASGLGTTPTSSLEGPDGPGGLFGKSSVGDVNGDGRADLAVAAAGVASSTGRAHVYLGSASGLATTPTTSMTGPDGAGGLFGTVMVLSN